MKIGIIGIGILGSAIKKSLIKKGYKKKLCLYDRYKKIGKLQDTLCTDIMFLCLPTPYSHKLQEYNKKEIFDICNYLSVNNYKGIVVIKSTVEPETTDNLACKYKNLCLIHNPEFLSSKTAFKDFHYQKHIVIGKSKYLKKNKVKILKEFYQKLYPKANISVCSSTESESMKIFCNCFYAVKIQFFTELYLLCQTNNTNFNKIVKMMLKNNWINPMHTKVPGHDKKISYGGSCFTKDTKALNQYIEKQNSLHKVLDSAIEERDSLRKDQINCE
jgi:nucleotide sugar dehydrogenase